jgi:hypothetical protein
MASELESARSAWAAGQTGLALRTAWSSASGAATRLDAPLLAALAALADEIALSAQGSQAADAFRLSAYCRACLEVGDDGVSAWSIARIFGRPRQKRKKCPDCAEQIAQDARVCRYCGYRYPV